MIEASLGVVPEFVAVKAGIFPLPLAAKPIDESLFVQVLEVAVPTKTTAVV